MDEAIQHSDLTLRAEINLYYDLYIPEGHHPPSPLLIAVHGYGAHKRYMMREAKLIAPDNCVIAAVQAPHQHFRQTDAGYRVGFGWLTDFKAEESIALHHKFLLDLIDKLKNEKLIDERRVTLYGFSQASALNFRFAFTYPEAAGAVVAACGGIPGDLETNDRYKPFNARTLYLYGDDDEFYTQEQFSGFEKKLRETLPNFQSKQFRAKHEITEEMRAEIRDFLADA